MRKEKGQTVNKENIMTENDMQALVQLKELVTEFNNILNMKFDNNTTVDIESIREAASYVDVGLDMEILKLNEHNQD